MNLYSLINMTTFVNAVVNYIPVVNILFTINIITYIIDLKITIYYNNGAEKEIYFMTIDDDNYINRLKEVRIEQQHLLDELINNINNLDYLHKLRDVRMEEQRLIDRLIEERKHLSEESKIDPLTGLYNRNILPKIREIGAVIMCDLDDFKSINDTYGHDIGDKALKAVGQSISQNIRIGDIGCRFGGDEFIIVFTTDLYEVIDRRLNKIVEDANKIFQMPERPITFSMGVAFNKDGLNLQELMKEADEALYKSKENGKNQITYYERLYSNCKVNI